MRTIIIPDTIYPSIKNEIANFYKDIIKELADTAAQNRVCW